MCLLSPSYHQDFIHGGKPTSSPGGDQIHHAVCCRLLSGVQRGRSAPDDRPCWKTTGNDMFMTEYNSNECIIIFRFYDVLSFSSFLPPVWHICYCCDHDQDSNQREVPEAYEWDRSHWEQVGPVVMLSLKSLLSFSSFSSYRSLKRTHRWNDHGVTLDSVSTAYTATWWNTWMLRLFCRLSVMSKWLWTGFAPPSFTSEPSRTPHTMVRAFSCLLLVVNQLWGPLIFKKNQWVSVCPHFHFRILCWPRQMWNWSKIARWAIAVLLWNCRLLLEKYKKIQATVTRLLKEVLCLLVFFAQM